MKKLGRVLFSMRTALIILFLLIAACVAGSVIPQQEIEAYYTGYYPERVGWLILLLGLNDVFHSLWFLLLTAFLCVNLLGCNLIHFPGLIRRTRTGFTPEKFLAAWDGTPDVTVSDPTPLFAGMGFRRVQSREGLHYAVRHRAGLWGAWLTHLGMLIIIAGFALGQMATVKYTVYGVPGQVKPVADTNYDLRIDGFSVLLRRDSTVEQYVAELTLSDRVTGASKSGIASVNHPMQAMGMKLYQNSTGWAANVQVYKGEELIQQALVCAGEHLEIDDVPGLVLAFRAFYPDYIRGEDGAPTTASPELKNPAYLYTLYYEEGVLGMNVLQADERITVEDYSIIFKDPQQYTLIQLKDDPFTWLAAVGGVVIVIALLLAFYLRTEELLAVKQENGWAVVGRSKKGGVLFRESLLEKAEALQKEEQS